MGRVERRVYKQKKRRLRRGMLLLLVLLAAAAGVALNRGGAFRMERVAQSTQTPGASEKSAKTETREVVMPEDAWYAIQTGVYSTREAADERAADFIARGAPGTVIADGEKWRVFIACYGKEADASAVRQRLGDRQQVETYLYAWSCPRVVLRMSGQADQLDIVEAGFTLLPSTAAALRDAAMLLDAAQLTVEEAVKQADALANQMSLWAKTARERFGQRVPELVRSMLVIAEEYAGRAKDISKAGDSAMTLSAEMKKQAMQLYDQCVNWRTALNTQ